MNFEGKKVIEFLKKNWLMILFSMISFFTILMVYRVSPMVMDGWASALTYTNTGGIVGFLKCLFDLYKTCNGRIISNLFCGILESFRSEIPLDFFNALIMISIFIITYFICKKEIKISKHKFCFGIILFIGLIFSINPSMRTEVLFYANTAYMPPIPMALVYYYYLIKLINSKTKLKREKQIILILSLLGCSIGLWMEHIALGFLVTISIITFLLFIKKSNYKFKVLIPNIVTFGSFIIMMLAPGLRANRNIVSKDPIFLIITNNIKTFYVDIISKNLLLIMILIIFIIIILLMKNHKKFFDFVTIIFSILLFSVFLLTFIYRSYGISTLEFINFILPVYSYGTRLYPFLIVMIILLYLVLYTIILLKNKKIALYSLALGIFSLAPLLISPNMGARISSIGFFAIVILVIIYYFEIKEYFIAKVFCIAVITISVDQMIIVCRRIEETHSKINRITSNILNQQELGIYNYSCFDFAPFYASEDSFFNGPLLQNTVHYKAFLEAYNLNDRTRIIFSNKKIAAVKKICIEKNKIVFHNDIEYKDNLYFQIQYIDVLNNKNNENYETELLQGDLKLDLKCGYYIVKAYYKKSDNTYALISDSYEFVI